jgi:hypothetical protein
MSSPGVAAQYAVKCQPAPIYKPVLLQCLNSILGAGGRKAANTRGKRRYGRLIKPDEDYKRCCYNFF